MRNKDYQTISLNAYSRGLGACTTTAIAGLRTIKAKALDEFGDILPGVSVWVEGDDTKGTSTDINGDFQLKDVPPNALINFSYIGTLTQVQASEIQDVVHVNTVIQSGEVVINALKNNKTIKYVGYGFLALLVLYGISRMGSKTVKASV